MSTGLPPELYFLLDREAAIIAFQERDQSWAGALAFSSEDAALKFAQISKLKIAEVAAISFDDATAISGLINAVKKRSIRHLLLDLDYRTGRCSRIDFENDRLGAIREHQFVAPPAH